MINYYIIEITFLKLKVLIIIKTNLYYFNKFINNDIYIRIIVF